MRMQILVCRFRLHWKLYRRQHADRNIAIDDVGNQNNVLIVKPQSRLKAHEDKHAHARPHADTRDSARHHAWESTGTSRIHEESTEKDHISHADSHAHKKHCNISGHHNTNCSAHGSSSDPTCICDAPSTPPDNIVSKDSSPAIRLPHSSLRPKGDSRHGDFEMDTQPPVTPLDAAGSTVDSKTRVINNAEEINADDATQTERVTQSETGNVAKFGDGKIPAADVEKVKLLMSIPDMATKPTGVTIEDPIPDVIPNGVKSTSDPATTQSTSRDLCPLFPHESQTPGDHSENHHTHKTSSISRPEEGRYHSVDYPLLEVFPSGAGQILRRIATTRSQLDADETIDEAVSTKAQMPVTELKNSPTFSHERCPVEQSMPNGEDTPSPNPLPPSLSPTSSQERKYADMGIISEQSDTESIDGDEFVATASPRMFSSNLWYFCHIRNSPEPIEDTIGHSEKRINVGGVGVSANQRSVREEDAEYGRRYSTAAKSGYNLLKERKLPDSFDGTSSQFGDDEHQPLLTNAEIEGDYTGLRRTSFDSEGTRKRRATIDSSTTTSSETSDVTAIPAPFYVTFWLWCLHWLSAAFAKIFRREDF